MSGTIPWSSQKTRNESSGCNCSDGRAFAASTVLWSHLAEAGRLTLNSNVLLPLGTAFLLKPSRAGDARTPLSGTRRDTFRASLKADRRSAGQSGNSCKGFVGMLRGLPKGGRRNGQQ